MSDFALVNYIFSVCFTRKQKKKREYTVQQFFIVSTHLCVIYCHFSCPMAMLLIKILPSLTWPLIHIVNRQRRLLKTNSTQLKHCNQQFIRQINKNNSITHVHVSCQYLTSLHMRGYTSDMDRPKCWCGLRSSKENRNHNNIFSWCTSLSLNIFKKIRSQ